MSTFEKGEYADIARKLLAVASIRYCFTTNDCIEQFMGHHSLYRWQAAINRMIKRGVITYYKCEHCGNCPVRFRCYTERSDPSLPKFRLTNKVGDAIIKKNESNNKSNRH